MNEMDVIRLLREHLKAKEKERGIKKVDRYYAITYLMDFLCISRTDAIALLQQHIPYILKLKGVRQYAKKQQ